MEGGGDGDRLTFRAKTLFLLIEANLMSGLSHIFSHTGVPSLVFAGPVMVERARAIGETRLFARGGGTRADDPFRTPIVRRITPAPARRVAPGPAKPPNGSEPPITPARPVVGVGQRLRLGDRRRRWRGPLRLKPCAPLPALLAPEPHLRMGEQRRPSLVPEVAENVASEVKAGMGAPMARDPHPVGDAC